VAGLVLGPMLRHTDADSTSTWASTWATIWVQTDAPCRVSVQAGRVAAGADTFTVHGHHYAVVDVAGLAPGSTTPYEVTLDGEAVWPPPGSPFPPPAIRIPDPAAPVRLVFGSCRTSVPHDAGSNARYGVDVLRAYAHRLAAAAEGTAAGRWPTLLLMLGDQVYADETSPAMQRFIASRRDPDVAPGLEIADFTEYAEVYRLAWSDPAIRWMLSCVPTAMIFDDHDIRDDWNTSAAWRARMAELPWWRDRILGGLGSYWVYQHLGNLSPSERDADPLLTAVRGCPGDAWSLVEEFAARADAKPEGTRWSYARDLGGTRLIVVDSRAGRVLAPGERAMLDPVELAWLDDLARGDVDHLLIATSVPFLLPPGLHDLEGWTEAVCDGAWGTAAARVGERIRQGGDLEHWAAFRRSFAALARIAVEVAAGRRGRAPASISFLSGDVHNSYLARVDVPGRLAGRVSPIYQLVCSPVRNQLPRVMRWTARAVCSRAAAVPAGALARAAGVRPTGLSWRVERHQRFVNSLATLDLAGREAVVRWETAGDGGLVELTRARLA
jgi:hypothetical protein